ncbi:MAG: hypothetical protein SGILL_009495 [Bacillariaceae sp.]
MVQVKVVAAAAATGVGGMAGNGGQTILPSSGRMVYLEKGATLYLEREDANPLLQSGVCQLLVEGEEVD